MKKLQKISNRILIFSLLILVVDLFNKNLVTDFYNIIVYVLGLGGIILSLILKIMIKNNIKLDKLTELIDTISVLWSFFFVFYFVVCFVFYPARVNGSSMRPNYEDNDIIFIWHFNHKIERFDVVLVNVTNERHYYPHDEYFLKRVIGLPGDHIEYINDTLYVNGEEVSEPFKTNTSTKDFSLEEVCRIKNVENACTNNIIPEGYYFVMGDNRDYSKDSREIGLVNRRDIFGKSVFTLNDWFR